jgi:hypothetical protein
MTAEQYRNAHGWFGTPWNGCYTDDGRVDEAMRIDVPVGEFCTWCNDMFFADDSGKAVPVIGATPVIQYMHRECLMRSVVGGLDHLSGRCICCSPDGAPDGLGGLAAGMTAHQEALAVDEHVFRHGIGQ